MKKRRRRKVTLRLKYPLNSIGKKRSITCWDISCSTNSSDGFMAFREIEREKIGNEEGWEWEYKEWWEKK